MSEIYMRTGTTDPSIGVPFAEIIQSQTPIDDRLAILEQRVELLGRKVAALNMEIAVLQNRTWWTMLKDLFKRP